MKVIPNVQNVDLIDKILQVKSRRESSTVAKILIIVSISCSIAQLENEMKTILQRLSNLCYAELKSQRQLAEEERAFNCFENFQISEITVNPA